MFTLTKGQQIKINLDVEIWNDDDSLAARIDAGTTLEITEICHVPSPEYSGNYYNVDVKVISNIYDGYTTNLDISPEDIA